MMDPVTAVVIMVVASFVIGYVTMTTLITVNRTPNLNKVYASGLMALLMGLVEVGMHAEHMEGRSFWITTVVLTVGAVVFVYLIRRQVLIDDSQFNLSMIEHHQMAIDMAQRLKARTRDPEMVRLADEIIQSQRREIAFMWQKYYGGVTPPSGP